MKLLTKDFYILSNEKDLTIRDIRKQLLWWILVIIIFMTVPIVIVGIIEAINLNQTYVAVLYLCFFIPILLAFVFHNLFPYKISVYLILFSGYTIGVINTIIYGFSSAAIPLFLSIAVLSAIFFTIKAGFTVLFLSIIPMIIVAFLMSTNRLSIDADLIEMSKYPLSWFTAIIVLLFLGSVLILGFGIIQDNLLHTLMIVKKQTSDLQKANLQQEEDLNYRKKIQKELEDAVEKAKESDRLKSAFLANMSHEIRTPMNGILGFANLLKKSNLTGDTKQEYIQIIEKSGLRMLNIINNILNISKIESGLIKVDIRESNINDKLEFVYDFFKPKMEKKGIEFNLKSSLYPPEAIIKTDPEKVFAILTNLIDNAREYTNKGSIDFGCSRQKDHILFFVKDTGIGIPENRLGAIFDRFIQVDISDQKAKQGAGLGLSIAQAYVKILGGEIWVESEVDKGSSFFFTLPYTYKEVNHSLINKKAAEN